jgi:hypothetical protein
MIVMQPPASAGPGLEFGAVRRLFVGRSMDLQSTADQVMSKQFSGTLYRITDIVAVGKTGGASVACLGGIYTATSKGGSVLVSAAQSWLGVSAADKMAQATLAGLLSTDAQTVATLYFSLTTGSTAACTADVFVYGQILD